MEKYLIQYSGYILAAIGFIFGIIQYILRRKHENIDKLIERRYDTYKEYLKKLDSIHEEIRKVNIDNLFESIKVLTSQIMDNPSDLTPITKFQSNIFDLTSKSVSAFYKTSNELSGLRLICSNNLLTKVNRYSELSKISMDDFQNILSNINIQNINIEVLKNKFSNTNFLELETLKIDIEKTMRDEIGVK